VVEPPLVELVETTAACALTGWGASAAGHLDKLDERVVESQPCIVHGNPAKKICE